jgi:hypothetical protein
VDAPPLIMTADGASTGGKSGRVRRVYCYTPLPSEPGVRLSPHPAQANHPEDTLPQIAHNPVGFAPVDARPIGVCLGSVCEAYRLHLTFASVCSLCDVLWVVHQAHVSRLSAWVLPYPAGYVFPVPFGVLAFASWAFLFPLKSSASLAVGLLVCTRLQRGFHVPLQ